MTALAKARERRGIKKSHVKDELGVSYPTYMKYEKDPDSMTVAQAKKVCAIIGCDFSEIFLADGLSDV